MRLRPATTDDDRAYFLRLRNDPDTVRYSWSKRPVSQHEHEAWWDMTGDLRYVAVTDFGGEVGTIRITPLDESTCEVHIVVAPEARDLGHSVGMLREAGSEARGRGYTRIVARVDAPNTPSLRAFLRAGYDVTSTGTLLLERKL